jgi:hypothetical protein
MFHPAQLFPYAATAHPSPQQLGTGWNSGTYGVLIMLHEEEFIGTFVLCTNVLPGFVDGTGTGSYLSFVGPVDGQLLRCKCTSLKTSLQSPKDVVPPALARCSVFLVLLPRPRRIRETTPTLQATDTTTHSFSTSRTASV